MTLRKHRRMAERFSDFACTAGITVMRLAGTRGDCTQAAMRKRLEECAGVDIAHQKLSQWINGEGSFPNDFAEVFTAAYKLDEDEQIELALALSFGQKRRRLLRRDEP